MEGRLDIAYLGVRTENVRRFAPKRVLVDTNQAAGWAGGLGGALRVSQYTMAGRVGGCEKTTSIEFGVVSAECRVQSAGSLLGGGLPKLAMSGCGGGQLCVPASLRCRNNSDGKVIPCFVQQQFQGGRDGTGEQANTILGNAPSLFDLCVQCAMCYVLCAMRGRCKTGKGGAPSQAIRQPAATVSSSAFRLGRKSVADWLISSTPHCLLTSLDLVTDRA